MVSCIVELSTPVQLIIALTTCTIIKYGTIFQMNTYVSGYMQ